MDGISGEQRAEDQRAAKYRSDDDSERSAEPVGSLVHQHESQEAHKDGEQAKQSPQA